MVAQLDLAPTLLDFAGVEVPDTVDGRSLRPLFENGAGEWRTDLLLEHNGHYGLYLTYDTLAQVRGYLAGGLEVWVPTYRALRTERHLYVEWYGGSEHEYELYDLVADPWEMTNLLSTPEGVQENAALRAQHHARMETLSICSGVSCRN
jgi:N-acetylglucosamine-6-sulfatase